MRYLVQVDLAKVAKVKSSLSVAGVRPITTVFDYITIDIPPELIPKIRAIPGVIAIIPDRKVEIKQILLPIDKKLAQFQKIFFSNPITGPAMAFKFSLAVDTGKQRVPTSESRKMLGADVAEAEGITGKGIKVAVLDTGTDVFSVQGSHLGGKSSVEGHPVQIDENGHGCTTGDSMIITTFCGVVTLEELYQKLEAKYGAELSEIGYSVFPKEEICTVGFSDTSVRTRVQAVHQIPYRGKLYKVHTSSGIFKTTPWHLFLVKDRRSEIPRYMRADKLTLSRNYYLGSGSVDLGRPQTLSYSIPYPKTSNLVCCPQCGKVMNARGLWFHCMHRHTSFQKGEVKERGSTNKTQDYSLAIDENLAYLAGLIAGDGYLSQGRSKFVSFTPGEDTSPLIPILRQFGFSSWYGHDKKELRISSICWYVLKALGLPLGRKLDKLRIPELVIKSPSNIIYAFLAGLVDTDSWFSSKRVRLKFISSSANFVKDLCTVLSYLGYASRIGHSRYRTGLSYQISLVGGDLIHFLEHVQKYLKFKKVPNYEGKSLRKNYRWVRDIQVSDFDGNLYDLTTDTDNYLAGEKGLAFIHNTHVANTINGKPFQSIHGLLKGVAVDAEVAAFKVLGYGIGAGTLSSILRGMMDAFEWGADIISMSLGSDYTEDPPEAIPECRAVEMLTKQGMIVVIANGNAGPAPNTVGVAANSPYALSVGAIDIDGSVPEFSSRGPTAQGVIKPDVVAPGVNILAASAGLIATMNFFDGPPKLAAISGTSMSTPHVSGIVSLALQYARMKGKNLTTDHIKEAMSLYGQYAGAKNNDMGWGLLTYQILKRYVDEKLVRLPSTVAVSTEEATIYE